MDVLKLLAEAQAAGLRVRAVGDKLVINGPKEAEPIVQKLGANKAAVMAAITNSPAPCQRCGCALGWRTTDGRIACAKCEPKPAAAEMLILAHLANGPVWRRYADERRRQIDSETGEATTSWDDAAPWDNSTLVCPNCQSVACWIDGRDGWHCLQCEPPLRSERLLRDRERILAEAWRRMHERRKRGP